MARLTLTAVFCALLAFARASPELEERTTLDPVCEQIKGAISSASSVAYPGLFSTQFTNDMYHWMSSSSQDATCSVEPGTAQDVAAILKILGSTRTPFAVKGGGHASNPGFSSTTGVMVAMSKFNEVTYDETSQTAVVGSGLIWDDVYAALAPYNVNVVGGRVSGVGVAGFTLGGGLSWKTNQFGMTADNVVAYELVKPDGAIVNVTLASDADLFFGLRGGFNNFGIVTRFTMKTHHQPQIWGGITIIPSTSVDAVSAATVNFAKNVKDPKAAVLPTYDFAIGSTQVTLLMFYDGPNPPAGIFDEYLAIPYLIQDVKTRDFLSLVKASPSHIASGFRGIFNSVSIREYSPAVMKAVQNETQFWGNKLALKSGVLISYDVEPFLPDIFQHADSPSPYPVDRSFGFSPFNLYFSWLSSLADDVMQDAARQSAAQIKRAALADGQDLSTSSLYPNYCIYDTPLSAMYGGNVDKLKALKARVDPENVMGLAGGFKF